MKCCPIKVGLDNSNSEADHQIALSALQKTQLPSFTITYMYLDDLQTRIAFFFFISRVPLSGPLCMVSTHTRICDGLWLDGGRMQHVPNAVL